MSGPVFLARTPRAGRWNHCFLAAEGTTLTSEQMADFADLVTLTAPKDSIEPVWGQNFAGLAHLQVQADSVREGREVLVLAGVAVSRLSPGDKQLVAQALERRLADLDRLVCTIDWQGFVDRPSLVKRPELREWLETDFPQGLPAAPMDRVVIGRQLLQPSVRGRWASRLKVIVVSLLVLVAVAVVALLILSGDKGSEPTNGDNGNGPKAKNGKNGIGAKSNNGKNSNEQELYQRLVTELARNGFSKKEELELELERGNLREENKRLGFLKEYENGQRTADGWLFLLFNERGQLHRLHGKRAPARENEVKETREKLKRFNDDFRAFQTTIWKNQFKLEGQAEKQYFTLIRALTEKGGKFELPSPNDKNEPAWFSSDDVKKADHRFMVLIRIKASASGHFPAKNEIDDERRVIAKEIHSKDSQKKKSTSPFESVVELVKLYINDSEKGKLASQYDALVELVESLRRLEPES